jgi:hypothetical protein
VKGSTRRPTTQDNPRGFPEEFAIYMNYVRKLGFEETPDYDFLRELFTKVLKTLGEPDDGVFDWMLLNGGKGWEASQRAKVGVTGYGMISTHLLLGPRSGSGSTAHASSRETPRPGSSPYKAAFTGPQLAINTSRSWPLTSSREGFNEETNYPGQPSCNARAKCRTSRTRKPKSQSTWNPHEDGHESVCSPSICCDSRLTCIQV